MSSFFAAHPSLPRVASDSGYTSFNRCGWSNPLTRCIPWSNTVNGASTRFAGKGKVAWLMMICPPTPASAIPVTCRVTSPSYTTFPWCFVALDTLPQCTPMRTRKPSYVPQTRRVPAVASCTSAGHAAAIRSSCT